MLNKQQQAAVQYLDGPLLVIAGAGSGKTRVIATKIAYLLEQKICHAKQITAITFSNHAAAEMRQRTAKLIGADSKIVNIFTFHAFGLKVLRECAKYFGYKPNFSVLATDDIHKIIAELAPTAGINELCTIQKQISLWKNALLTSTDVIAAKHDTALQLIANIYQQYQEVLLAYRAVDLDDLLLKPLELFKQHADLLTKYQQQISYLLVDEYQDSNACQYDLLKTLSGTQGNFTLVGDDAQAIYAWRGACSETLSALLTDYPQLHTITLEQNYRSSATILGAANTLISQEEQLFSKKLWSQLGTGKAIAIKQYDTDVAEAEYIAKFIAQHQRNNMTKLEEYAILCRTNFQMRIIHSTLQKFKIPYTTAVTDSLFEQVEIKDMLAYLRLIVNHADDGAFVRAITTPKRGIGVQTFSVLSIYATNRDISLFDAVCEEGFASICNAGTLKTLQDFVYFIDTLASIAPEQLLMMLINTIDYEAYLYNHYSIKVATKRYDNILWFVQWFNKRVIHQTLTELVQAINLFAILDIADESEESAVIISTIHAAKGLEYKYVFLVGCEEGNIPHKEAINNHTVAEERRLMYVGITRAQQELYISYCAKRVHGSALVEIEPSRFLAELGTENIKHHEIATIPDIAHTLDRFTAMRNLISHPSKMQIN